MPFHKKVRHAADYGYMLRGTLTSVIYREPPKHYLGHIVGGKAPVILIPGILGKWSFMKHLGDKISLEGHPVYIVPKLGLAFTTYPHQQKRYVRSSCTSFPNSDIYLLKSDKATQTISELIEKENLSGAILVAHSKGGLIGKYLLAHHNKDNRVSGMVAIATPFSGSAMAKLIPHDSFRELRTDSEVIQDLEKHTDINNRIISVIPEYDNHVWAKRGSFLDGALENKMVPARGHHKVLFSEATLQAVLNSIEEIAEMKRV